ncbi:MAG: BlaI/MecI/CopY family transcriptional regulator [Dermatophilaceae bacterium]
MPATSSTPRLGDLERTVMECLWDAAAPPVPDTAATDTAAPGREAADGTSPGETAPDTQPRVGATVRDVHDILSGTREIAYTTVLTVLDRLAKKGLVTRERDGRAWRYQPADTREALTAQTMRHTMDAMAATDRRAALLHFLDGASNAELDDLKAALAEVEARADGRGRRPGR